MACNVLGCREIYLAACPVVSPSCSITHIYTHPTHLGQAPSCQSRSPSDVPPDHPLLFSGASEEDVRQYQRRFHRRAAMPGEVCPERSRRVRDDKSPITPRSRDRKSTRLNSSHLVISYAVFCLK